MFHNYESTLDYTEMRQLCWTGTVDIFFISQPKWLKFGLQAHLFKMFGHAKLQLSISFTFKVMINLVKITKYTTKTFITLKVQEIESWNFVCPNILKRCAWTPNFSHFGWEMTKIWGVGLTCTLSEWPALHCTSIFSLCSKNLSIGWGWAGFTSTPWAVRNLKIYIGLK